MSFFERHSAHEEFLGDVLEKLCAIGYRTERLSPDGYRPDGRVFLPCKGSESPCWVDAKTRHPRYKDNFSVELEAVRFYATLPEPVFIVWGNWTVDTPESMFRRMTGPRSPTGGGSTTWLYLVEAHGATSFDLVFPPR